MLGGATEVGARAAASAAMRPNAARLLPCRPKGPNLPRLRYTKSTSQGAGRACAQGTRPARRACRGVAGFARHAFGFGSLSVEPHRINLPREAIHHFVAPQGRSVLRSLFSGARQRPLSYMSYRVGLWHVADVPGVQGTVEVWKLGCLEVWLSRCTTISPVARLSGVL